MIYINRKIYTKPGDTHVNMQEALFGDFLVAFEEVLKRDISGEW